MSGSAGKIFAVFSLNESILGADDRSGARQASFSTRVFGFVYLHLPGGITVVSLLLAQKRHYGAEQAMR